MENKTAMDGTQTISQRQPSFYFSTLIAITLVLSSQGPLAAQTPLRFQPEQVPRPIRVDSPRQWTSPQEPPTLVRPRAQVIVAERPPAMAVLSPPTADQRMLQVAVRDPATVEKRGKPPRTIEEALDRKGSVTFRKTPLAEVVFLLSDLWQVNIVAGEHVTGEVSGAFFDAPLREVLSAALAATGYSYRQTGNSLIVLPAKEVGTDNPDFVSEMIDMPRTGGDTATTIEAAQMLLSERGQLRRVGVGSVLVVDTAKRVARIRQLFDELAPRVVDQTPIGINPNGGLVVPTAISESGIAYFTPQFTEAEEMVVPLREAMGGNVVVAVYAEENRIMVKGTPDELRIASQAIEQLDRPRPQVRITAMIYDVALSELENLGVDWNVSPHSSTVQALSPSVSQQVFRNSFEAGSSLISDPSASGAGTLALRTLNSSINVGAFLQAVNSAAESKLLADPSITVGDRREASIRIVQRIPIVVSNPVQNSAVAFSTVQFEDAGVILNVTPRISRDGTIEMIVTPEYSVVVDFIDNNPVIDSRTAQTTLRVANGHMFVLGGLRQKTINETIRGVPFLKDMKYVGKLFRAHETQIRESELIVFIKPEIVMPDEFGTARERRASCVTGAGLDSIAHADDVSQLPHCGNPGCPNHSPRCRINGGSQSLEPIGDFGPAGMPLHQGIHSHSIIENNAAELTAPDLDQQTSWSVEVAPMDFSQPAPLVDQVERQVEQADQQDELPVDELPTDDDSGFPPVHIDRGFSRK